MIVLLLCAAALLAFPTVCADAAREGIALCLQSIIPSLFPFFVLSALAVSCGAAETLCRPLARRMQPLFGIGTAGTGAWLLGLLGGYPVGAKTVAALFRQGDIDRREAENLLTFCCSCGPGFLLGICGGVLRHPLAGIALFAVHAAAGLLAGLVLCRRAECTRTAAVPPKRRFTAALLPEAVQGSARALAYVCAFVVLFFILLRLGTHLLSAMGIALPDGVFRAILFGFIELTNGAAALPASRAGFIACAAIVGWGGCSVHAQTAQVLAGSGLSMRPYLRGKAVQALFSIPLAALVSLLLY